MPMVTKENGYPVDAKVAAEAVVEKSDTPAEAAAPRVLKTSTTTQPSVKDRSIINQTAWKIAGPAAANWSGNVDEWFEAATKIREKVEAQMLSVYNS